VTDLTPQELEEIGVTAEEVDEASKGWRTLNGAVMNRLREVLERRRHRKDKDEERGRQELDGLQWDAYVNKVRGERRERQQQLRRDQKVIDAMTPAQYDAWKRQRDSQPVEVHRFAKRERLALETAEVQDRKAINRAREQHEQELGLPDAQRDWQRRDEEITQAVAAKRAKLREDERALNEWIREQREENGDCPTLESLEAIA
jgi:hypothetical protein